MLIQIFPPSVVESQARKKVLSVLSTKLRVMFSIMLLLLGDSEIQTKQKYNTDKPIKIETVIETQEIIKNSSKKNVLKKKKHYLGNWRRII